MAAKKNAAKAVDTAVKEVVKEAPKVAAPVKAEAPKAEAPKAEKPAKKAAAPKAEKPAKKAAAPKAEKAPAKKAVKASETVFVEYAGGQINVSDIVAKVKEAAGDAKELKVYYQPENGVVYYTADGKEGSVNL